MKILKTEKRICPCCTRRWGSVKSCTCNAVDSEGELFERIRYGAERWSLPAEVCPTCGVARGGYHHPGCDYEDSPIPGIRLGEIRDEPDPLYVYAKVSQQTLDREAKRAHSIEDCENAG